MCAISTAATCGRRRRCRSATSTAPYIVRHGRGYSRFEVVAHGIALELLQYVPLADPIKISRLTIRNVSGRPRRLSVTAYVEWVLGLSRGASAPTVVTERDAATGAIFARNPWNMHHGTRVAFADLGGRQTAWTADRSEFIGRNCTTDNPAALSAAIPLSQRVGAGLDPVRGPADDDRARARRRDRDRLLPRPGRRRRRGAGADRALSRSPISTPSIARSSTTGTRRSARCR